MKRLLLLALCAATAPAFAQVTSTSQTAVQTGASAGASNSGVTNLSKNVFESSDHMKYDYGTQRIDQVAPLSLGGAAAGFSNENCANTAQIGGAFPWLSLAKADPKESIRCNARRDAGVYTALAADSRANGEVEMSSRLRAMARWSQCTATAAQIEACKAVGILPPTNTLDVAPEQDNAGQDLARGVAAFSADPSVDKNRTPATRDSGWIEPRR